MFITTKLAVAAIAGLSLTAVGVPSHDGAQATPAFRIQETSPTITITNAGGNPAYVYSPEQLEAKTGQAITVTNNDPSGVHTITAKDKSFSVDVPPKSSVTLTVSQPGNYP